MDLLCVSGGGFDIAYLSKLDPLWNDDLLSAIISPESLLFANPIAQLACMTDAIQSNIALPNDVLFWCMGSWESTYPLSGHFTEENTIQAHAAAGARMLYKLSRQGMLWNEAINYCAPLPIPIWIKSHLKMQLATPIRDISARYIGVSGLRWGIFKHPPGLDNWVWVIFKKRNRCNLFFCELFFLRQ